MVATYSHQGFISNVKTLVLVAKASIASLTGRRGTSGPGHCTVMRSRATYVNYATYVSTYHRAGRIPRNISHLRVLHDRPCNRFPGRRCRFFHRSYRRYAGTPYITIYPANTSFVSPRANVMSIRGSLYMNYRCYITIYPCHMHFVRPMRHATSGYGFYHSAGLTTNGRPTYMRTYPAGTLAFNSVGSPDDTISHGIGRGPICHAGIRLNARPGLCRVPFRRKRPEE